MKLSPLFDSLLQKLEHYCSYQDRCTRDIQRKMKEWKVPENLQEKLLKQLRSEGFIDDRRFALSFVRGKFHANKWGRIRIAGELRARGLPEALISEALQEVGEEEYQETIRQLITRKNREINPEKMVNKRKKILTFVVGKGFETDLVLRIIQEIKI
ncbi:MAG: RecX family transcriptional regulator [Bacteroidales bacterium]|nr:RecX family transcriptional regulator [Bacteroidales bacterium]